MRIALVCPPFIPVPPPRYGGTELFVADLASALVTAGHQVIVYANGESRVAGELRYLYPKSDWPLPNLDAAAMKDLDHAAWACADAVGRADVIHVNGAPGVVFSRFTDVPFVVTLHHPHEPHLTALYMHHPRAHYVAISRAQQAQEPLRRITTIHHGVALSRYHVVEQKEGYLAFLGRMAPSKGPHLAIEVARRAGLPLKMAGEVQPMYREYWETMVAPHVDGRQVQFLGEADLQLKNELLGHATALLFPITWHEPFGLVMIEAMACGTPVLAFDGGSVREIVRDGVSGWVCQDATDMAERARRLSLPAQWCRDHVASHFSVEHMARQYEEVYASAVEGARVRVARRRLVSPLESPATRSGGLAAKAPEASAGPGV